MPVDLLILTLIWALLGALVGWLAHAARWGLGAYGLGERASWMVDGRAGRGGGVRRRRAGLGLLRALLLDAERAVGERAGRDARPLARRPPPPLSRRLIDIRIGSTRVYRSTLNNRPREQRPFSPSPHPPPE